MPGRPLRAAAHCLSSPPREIIGPRSASLGFFPKELGVLLWIDAVVPANGTDRVANVQPRTAQLAPALPLEVSIALLRSVHAPSLSVCTGWQFLSSVSELDCSGSGATPWRNAIQVAIGARFFQKTRLATALCKDCRDCTQYYPGIIPVQLRISDLTGIVIQL